MFYVALRRDGDGSTRAIRVTESARIAGYNARVRVRGHTRAVTVIRRALWYRAQRGGYGRLREHGVAYSFPCRPRKADLI